MTTEEQTQFQMLNRIADLKEQLRYERDRYYHEMREQMKLRHLEQRDLRRQIDILTRYLTQQVALQVSPPVFVAPASVFRPFVERMVEDYDNDDWYVANWIVEARDLLKRHPNAL